MTNEEKANVVGKGSEKDVYCWVTSVPDSVQPPVAEGAIRAETHINVEKYGFCKDLPPDRPIRKGVYFRGMGYVDFKVHWIWIKLGRPFFYNGVRAFIEKVDKYIQENYEKL